MHEYEMKKEGYIIMIDSLIRRRLSFWKTMICLLLSLKAASALSSNSYPSPLHTGTISIEVECIIRNCILEDLHSVSELTTDSFSFSPSSTSRYHSQMEEYMRFVSHYPRTTAEHAQHRMLICTLAKEPHRAIGFCQLHNRPPVPNPYFTNNPRPLITDLVVRPSMRRKGIAKKMIDICECICQYDFGCPIIYLRVDNTNDVARKLYEGLGYEYTDYHEERHPELLVLQKKLF